VIDGKTNRVIDDIKLGRGITLITVNPLTNKIYTVDSINSTISVIDGKTDKVSGRNATSGNVIGVNTYRDIIYVSSDKYPSVTMLNGTTDKVLAGCSL